jgi:hypothetical protein
MSNRTRSEAVADCRHCPDTVLRPFPLTLFEPSIKSLVGKSRRDHDNCIGFHLSRPACVDAGKLHMILFYGGKAMGKLESRAGFEEPPLYEFLFERQLREIRHHG